MEISKRTMPFHHVPFLSSRAKANEAGMWVCDVCIKTNQKSIKGNIPALLQKHEEASIERGRQWLQCLTTELLSGHKGPLVPPLHPWGSALNGHLCVGKSMGIWAKSPKPSAPITVAFQQPLTCCFPLSQLWENIPTNSS